MRQSWRCSGSGDCFEEERKVGVTLAVLAAQGVCEHDFDGHVELDLVRIRLDADQVALERCSVLEIDHRADVRHVDTRERAVYDRVGVQFAAACQLDLLHLVPGPALGADAARSKKNRAARAALVSFEIRIAGVGNLQVFHDR